MTGEDREPERVVARLRPHPRALALPAIALIALTGGTAYGLFALDELWQRLAVLVVGALAAVLLWLLPLVRWLSTQYLLTTRRLVLRRGLAVRTRHEVLLSRSYDVTLRQAGLQALFGSGDVLINTGLDRPIVLRDAPRAALVQSALSDLIETSTTSIATIRRSQPATGPISRRSRSGR